MTAKPRPAAALPSPYANPSAITRDQPGPDQPPHALADAPAHARAYTRAGANAQVPAAAGRNVEAAGRALVAALAKVQERQDALAAAIAVARASGVPDKDIRARLVIAGLLEADVQEALA